VFTGDASVYTADANVSSRRVSLLAPKRRYKGDASPPRTLVSLIIHVMVSSALLPLIPVVVNFGDMDLFELKMTRIENGTEVGVRGDSQVGEITVGVVVHGDGTLRHTDYGVGRSGRRSESGSIRE
jgi:hypothetical protein